MFMLSPTTENGECAQQVVKSLLSLQIRRKHLRKKAEKSPATSNPNCSSMEETVNSVCAAVTGMIRIHQQTNCDEQIYQTTPPAARR